MDPFSQSLLSGGDNSSAAVNGRRKKLVSGKNHPASGGNASGLKIGTSAVQMMSKQQPLIITSPLNKSK